MDMSWGQELLDQLAKIFPALVLSKALQRGFFWAAVLSSVYYTYAAAVRPVGSWFYWLDRYKKRLKASQELAGKVAEMEAEAEALNRAIARKVRAKHAAS